MLRFYNTLTRQKDAFQPLKPGHVSLYTCGPTVYNHPHIGNYRAYIFEDLLRRYLKYRGYTVTQVMNLTDVEDKIIRDSQQAGMPLRDFTSRYSRTFFEDLRTLNIEPAEVYPAATDHLPEMVTLSEAPGTWLHLYGRWLDLLPHRPFPRLWQTRPPGCRYAPAWGERTYRQRRICQR
jgi:cysteinyl-tRNA synthetase